ncbi:unnamed protein product [Adineta steineri]|uniref:Acyltransferase 3 domain-containing protein n=1 Tax=Adineta steineri TaxID=433720 RepID=A0A816BHX3_9BILA|nr:unnamed protein product [Adineta steineri]CAF1611049.1 unnamed protein product [Adineta steineri]
MSIFQPKEDLKSLFQPNFFPPIDGLRALASLSIIYVHICQIFVLFIPMYPAKEWFNYFYSNSFLFCMIFVNSLEIFFVISGFLLTYSILTNKNNNENNFFIFIFKRLLRYYPGLILILFYMYLFGDLELNNSKSTISNYIVHLLFIVNYVRFDSSWFYSLRNNWSNCVDFHVYIILTFILRLLWIKYKLTLKQIMKILICLLLLSVVISYYSFDSSIEIMKVGTRSHPFYQTNYEQSKSLFDFYNLTFPINKSKFIDHYKLSSFVKFYSPTHVRYGSFISGSILAIKLLINKNENFINENRIKKYFYWILSLFLFLIISIRPNMNQPDPPIILVCLIRQLISMAIAYILYTTLVDQKSIYYNKYLNQILSSKFFIPISKLSYLVYLIHLRLATDLINNEPLRRTKKYHIDIASPICFPFILIISQIIAVCWYCLVEQPFIRLTNRLFIKSKKNK